MRVGIDIDGVLADTFPLLVAELNTYFNRNIQLQDVFSYNIHEVYDIEAAQLAEFAAAKKNLLAEAPAPLPGAVDCVSRLGRYARVFIVSARREELRATTRTWLHKHGVAYDRLILLGNHDKAQTCVDLGLHVLVEDSLKNALQVSARGIRVLLLNAPYNQGELPAMVQRCFTWDDICARLHALADGTASPGAATGPGNE